MHHDRTVTERRLARVLDQRLRPAVYRESLPLDVAMWNVTGEPVPVSEGIAAPYEPVRNGAMWGPAWSTSWFRISGTVPAAWAGQRVEAVVDLGFGTTQPGFSAEGLVHRADGTPVKALNPRNAWLPVTGQAAGGEEFTYYIEAAANPVIFDSGTDGDPFVPTPAGGVAPWLRGETTAGEPLYRLNRMDLAVFDAVVWELVQDLDVLSGLMHQLPEDSTRRWQLVHAVDRALDAIDLQDIGGTAARARDILAPALASPAHAGAHRVSAVGHAHIDTAWLWPVRETVRKAARTVSNVTALMDDHPDFRFVMSQAQQLAWLKEQRPEVFARVVEKVRTGQFLPTGSLWVEPDTNLSGGESLVRQFVHGKRFYLDEFGVETKDMWLPDTFGYNAALPQLMKLAGIEWFLTQKISWNTTNAFPHHTFWWEGIDGTRIFSHFPPVDSYNGDLSGADIGHTERNFRDKGAANRSLVPFGYGDGGGGPTREMLARARRLEDLEGSARLEMEGPAEFFTKAREEYADAPVWVGELYLELHRGTLTSQLATKQGNRRSEHLLREAELWAATAAVRTGRPYPYELLDRVWKTVLLHQFHDILPGTSIAWVHREAEETYAEVARELGEVIDTAQRDLAAGGGGEAAGETVFNAAPHARDGVAALGASPRARAAAPVAARPTRDGGFVLDNSLVRITVDARGLVTSARDLTAGREALAPGTVGNLLQLHQDFPNQWDAWDVDAFYRDTVRDLTEADEVSAVPGGIRVVRSFNESRITQVLRLTEGSRRLDIETDVDWQECEKILKAAFPLDVRAAESSAEIPFGHVRRPTHTNTSWDEARFEICAHRYLHLAEPGWGAALVNDSSYGHDVTRDVRPDGGTTTTARISLLRAPLFPDPDCDRGEHRLRYALVLGADIHDAIREGYHFNLPERAVPGGAAVEPLVRVDEDGVVVEAVKLADDRSGEVIVRLYESAGGRAQTTLKAGFPVARARITDLLERDLEGEPAPSFHGNEVALSLRPFQILTLRLVPGGHEGSAVDPG
ncbi:glycoside hydrolase family 38 C-terminal domain-containing protein [Streptomyces sp. NPDC049967]|uniref:alpha-mannosidase n=1 Tax=unclassified Streptomyces TaxID=2593676 RepID=UPI002E2C0823|nr:glycoside hydrolase family 38 C-terminal domain-containing protein [Streptomyces sp. NBC_00342]